MADLIKNTKATVSSNRSQAGNLLSKLKIDNALYNIKDPDLELVAQNLDANVTEIESRLNALGKKTEWTAVSKGDETKKYATAVEQGTNGAITVTYVNLRDAALTKANGTKKFATSVTQDVDGVVSVAYDDALTSDVKRTATTSDATHNGLAATDLEAALQELDALLKSEANTRATADTNLIGTSADAKTADTIWGAKNYAKDLVDTLAGTDWSQNAATVKDIIDELNSGEGANLNTLVDKLKGMTVTEKGTAGQPGYRQANNDPTVIEYVQAAIEDVNAQSVEGISALDAEVNSTGGTNVSLHVSEVDGKITAVTVTDNTPTAIENAIKTLDSEVTSTDGTNVQVKVTETDGKITAVNITQDDTAKDSEVVKTVNSVPLTEGTNDVTINGTNIKVGGSGTYATGTVEAAILDLTSSKANKNAIGTASVNNWESQYLSNSETLQWTNTATTVYVPVSEQTL